jgi:redox-sensitive bicupin YhaK (pirin superfamily)
LDHLDPTTTAQLVRWELPFVMNNREEIIQAIEDYEQGRLGTTPSDQIAPRHFA